MYLSQDHPTPTYLSSITRSSSSRSVFIFRRTSCRTSSASAEEERGVVEVRGGAKVASAQVECLLQWTGL